jgi:2-methylcitrate dehydratase PrpD
LNARDLLSPLTTIDGQDQGLRARAGQHAADALTCLTMGVRTSEGRALISFYEESELKLPFASAAAAAAIIMFTEWDDIHVPSCVTPGAIAVPVGLALAEDETRFVAALCSGYAAGIALGEAIGGVSALPGTWPALLAAPAIAAVTASTALGLSVEERAQALVLALAGSSGRHGRPMGVPSARWLAIGEATLRGVRAADAARSGFKGDLDLLSSEWLMAQSASAVGWQGLRPDAILSVGLKPFVAARQGLNAIKGFLQILASGVSPQSISEVRVALPPAAVPVVSRPLNLGDRLSTIAHLGLQLGIVAFDPARLNDVSRTQAFSSETLAFAERVVVLPDESLSGESWPAKVAICVAGEWSEHHCSSVPGDPGNRESIRDLVMSKAAKISGEDPARSDGLEDLMTMKDGAVKNAYKLLCKVLVQEVNGGSRGVSAMRRTSSQ